MSVVLSPKDVARALDLTVERVRQLDAELRPARVEVGGRTYRTYDPAAIEAYASERAMRRAARGQP